MITKTISADKELELAFKRLKNQINIFESNGGKLDFNVRVTTRDGLLGYKAIYNNSLRQH